MAQQPEVKQGLELANLFEMSPMEPEEPDLNLQTVLADIMAGEESASVLVHRATPGIRKSAYLFQCDAAEFSLDRLRDEYGGGYFRIYVRVNGVNKANQLIQIEAPKNPPKQEYQPANQQNDLAMKMMEAMNNGFQQLGNLIVQSQQRNQVDPAELEDRFMNRMVMMQGLFSKSGGGDGGIETFLKGLEFAKSVGVVETKEPGTAEMLMETIKSVVPALGSMAMQKPVTLQPDMSQFPKQPPALQQETQPQSEDEMFNMVKTYVGILVSQAKADSDPYYWAGLVLEKMGEDEVKAMIDDPQAMEKLAVINPDVLKYREWFESLITEIKNMLTAEENPDTVSGHEAIK